MKDFVWNWAPFIIGLLLSFALVGFVVLSIPGCVTIGPQKETNVREIHQETCELRFLNDEGYDGASVIRQNDLREKAYQVCQDSLLQE